VSGDVNEMLYLKIFFSGGGCVSLYPNVRIEMET
jgi:hypothetical protein